jgi:hypothetical protein
MGGDLPGDSCGLISSLLIGGIGECGSSALRTRRDRRTAAAGAGREGEGPDLKQGVIRKT